ncbi:hypothetical protein [Roseimicrobium sp. ORNL1]|uniref:hypothetical protein n=1 Tax=Roseimicrobium sp. ORNL1 TaxID=2711231 RepID=UPI0013E11D3B|nr:hypothetical protein [Roseimicrobium sp. ORNL1]QIF02706.1 hypothetical protein G5S37_14635 [Roseimicrobium sp. ORNL1]
MLIDLSIVLCGVSALAILLALGIRSEHRYSIAVSGYITISVVIISWLGFVGWLEIGMAESFSSHRMPQSMYAVFLVPIALLTLLGLAVLPLFPLATSRNYAVVIFSLALAGSLILHQPRVLIGIAILAALWMCVHRIRASQPVETSP